MWSVTIHIKKVFIREKNRNKNETHIGPQLWHFEGWVFLSFKSEVPCTVELPHYQPTSTQLQIPCMHTFIVTIQQGIYEKTNIELTKN